MELNAKKRNFIEIFSKYLFILATITSVVALGFIIYYIFMVAIPTISTVGIKEFLLGTNWDPVLEKPSFGILPFIVGSIFTTFGAILIGVPVGVMVAMYMAFYVNKKLYSILKSGINLLAGIPSVVYGVFALNTIVPWIRNTFGGRGFSMLAGILVLAIMILPTVISLSEVALRAVPKENYRGAIGLGASKERALFQVVLPAAKSGVLSAIILGIGRAIGETMAISMVAGNQPLMPRGLFEGVRTMTTNIVIEMGYASAFHRDALLSTGAVLFVFILLINITFNIFKNRKVK